MVHGRGHGTKGSWGISVPSIQFCCESKLLLKKKKKTIKRNKVTGVLGLGNMDPSGLSADSFKQGCTILTSTKANQSDAPSSWLWRTPPAKKQRELMMRRRRARRLPGGGGLAGVRVRGQRRRQKQGLDPGLSLGCLGFCLWILFACYPPSLFFF